jgi:hypothetical protein
MDQASLVRLFRNWSNVEAVANLSPLYGVLGNFVADSEELLDLANEALPGQPPPNILFAAVHALLAGLHDEPLRDFYASLGGSRPAEPSVGALFLDFCRRHRAELLPIIRTRLTQTNEVRRSSLLLPVFAEINAEARKPLALFEIGPSAGLNLNFDRYHYRYGDAAAGDPDSLLALECEPRRTMPAVRVPEVAWRLGIDINPLDVSKPEDLAWLRALVWPEHTDRLALLNAALRIARDCPPPVEKGDILETLPEAIARAPSNAAFCVFATFVLHQLSAELRVQLQQLLLELSRTRPIHMVVIGGSMFVEAGSQRAGDEQVWLLRLRDGAGDYRVSAIANPHGRWIDCQPDSPWKPWQPAVQNP